jgi:uridylate kinase
MVFILILNYKNRVARSCNGMRIVIRVGGSVVGSPPDAKLLMQYADILKDLKLHGHEIVVIVGGGAFARDFIELAQEMELNEWDQDEVAISVSRIFAQLLDKRLGDAGCGTVATSIGDVTRCLKQWKIMVMGGLKPGMTTDAVAAIIAERIKADLLIKATDQDGIYDKDPKKHLDAKKLEKLEFGNLLKLFESDKHKAGIHQILDPEAVKILQKSRTKTIIVNGFKSENLLRVVRGEKIGTIIS